MRRVSQALKMAFKTLDLPGHLHTFRHAFISQALTRGVPEGVVRSWVGHVDPAMIRLYTHVSDEVSRRYVEQFASAVTKETSTKEEKGAR